MSPLIAKSESAPPGTPAPTDHTFWRVEGSLLNFSAMRTVAFFTWNAQTFAERWARRGGLAFLAVVFPLLYAIHRSFATRVLYSLLRGVSQDRLDLLGEEYFQYVLKPRLKPRGMEKLAELRAKGGRVVLVSHGLDHVMRPLAEFLRVERVVSNRLEFRDGLATGRLLEPIVRPRGGLAWLTGRGPDGNVALQQVQRDLSVETQADVLPAALKRARKPSPPKSPALVLFDPGKRIQSLSVRKALAGKSILLLGVTGFIGKVWLEKLLRDIPDIGRVYLLIRRQRGNRGWRRLEKIVEESPVFDGLHERYGNDLARFLGERIEVLEGDVSRPGLGLEAECESRLQAQVDLIVNSSGLTEFNPDLRSALAINVEATVHLLDFLRRCDHAALLHLSTCYGAGERDGRVSETLVSNYTPHRLTGFDAEQEWKALYELVNQACARAESPELAEEIRSQVLKKNPAAKKFSAEEWENHFRRHRSRWLRTHLTEAGTRRARKLGWPNTYTFTKSLSESLIEKRAADLPVAVVRPSIVESSLAEPFRGWNEGVNTSGPLSYLLGTYFRQLPSNERKFLDLIPVDLVARGMMLIVAALLERRQQRLYQLATSSVNPCDMRRSIELTSLAHRKHYRAQQGLEQWLRSRFDTIPVSKQRYQKFSAPRQKVIVRSLNRTFSPFLPRPPLARRERDLARVEKMIELYEPFILHNQQVFETENVELLSRALVPQERDAFGYDALSIDWWDYWINIHVPALRRWCYPLLEGRALESRPPRTFQLPAASRAGDAAHPAGRPGDKSLVSGATWPSS